VLVDGWGVDVEERSGVEVVIAGLWVPSAGLRLLAAEVFGV
jgi:hypothetical protein